METLVDLLGVAGRHTCLPTVVCCSSCDKLDAYSDLVEAEITRILETFQQAIVSWNQNVSAQSGDDSETGKDEQKSRIIIVTDACLLVFASGESPISAQVLINYALPMKKETYMRRIATCLAADGIVINMVVGGEVVILKSTEESSNLVIAEMPINKSFACFVFLLSLIGKQ